MRKAVEKHISTLSSNKKQQNEFMYDIDQLQLSQSREVFDKAAELFVAKWTPVNEKKLLHANCFFLEK